MSRIPLMVSLTDQSGDDIVVLVEAITHLVATTVAVGTGEAATRSMKRGCRVFLTSGTHIDVEQSLRQVETKMKASDPAVVTPALAP